MWTCPLTQCLQFLIKMVQYKSNHSLSVAQITQYVGTVLFKSKELISEQDVSAERNEEYGGQCPS